MSPLVRVRFKNIHNPNIKHEALMPGARRHSWQCTFPSNLSLLVFSSPWEMCEQGNCAGMKMQPKCACTIRLLAQFPAKMCLHTSPARTIPMPAQFPAKMCLHNSPARIISSQNVPAHFACSHNSHARTISSQNVPARFACSHNSRKSHARTIPMLAHCSRGKRSRQAQTLLEEDGTSVNATQLVDSLIPVPFRSSYHSLALTIVMSWGTVRAAECYEQSKLGNGTSGGMLEGE